MLILELLRFGASDGAPVLIVPSRYLFLYPSYSPNAFFIARYSGLLLLTEPPITRYGAMVLTHDSSSQCEKRSPSCPHVHHGCNGVYVPERHEVVRELATRLSGLEVQWCWPRLTGLFSRSAVVLEPRFVKSLPDCCSR